MEMTKFKKRYDAIVIPEQGAGELSWVDRLRTWREFSERGQITADLLEQLFKRHGPKEYQEQFRSLCPVLHDLLMEAYGKTEVLKAWKKVN